MIKRGMHDKNEVRVSHSVSNFLWISTWATSKTDTQKLVDCINFASKDFADTNLGNLKSRHTETLDRIEFAATVITDFNLGDLKSRRQTWVDEIEFAFTGLTDTKLGNLKSRRKQLRIRSSLHSQT